jgi:GT2 family glycosyltransferase
LVRYLPRAWHVLKTEGASALVAKLRRRFATTPLRVDRKPELLRLDDPCGDLVLHTNLDPLVSIIIPVHNQWPVTARCLAMLGRYPGDIPLEVLVVDDASHDETPLRLARCENLRVITNRRNLGFVRACNRGAGAALGKHLVFLNNDTQVQPGWLDKLVRTFEQNPEAGLVGSRLIYPDGRQQEAGAIIFEDGSAWNYGHLDDPYKPQYSYVREPDYVSGAALAIRRDLFERLGGFDEHFAPGYYEDADLAFRVRAAGYRVYYQPLSRVVHFEGVSAGTDEHAGTGMKRFQAINRQKFLDRWRDELASHGVRGEDLERQKERHVRRRAFVVDVYMLTPDRESGSLRMVNLFAILQELGYKVTFAATNLEAPEPYVSDLQMRGVEVLYRPYVKSIERHLKANGAIYDLVILSRADSAAKVMSAARRHCLNARIVYDTVDLHFLRERRLAELTGDKATRAVAERRRREELGYITQADTTLVVSPVEQDLLAREAPDADVRIVSNIHRIFGNRRPFAERRDLFFIGAFAHPPNTDAVLWFCREIFPLVLSEEPTLRFSVIGADPPAQVRALASDSVRILGHVADVTPFFDGCRLSVAPLRYGAGVKGKVNQSLAYGLPVVATTQAAEGMFLVDGESVLLADDPRAFAEAVVRLYRNPVLWERLSKGGLAVMEQHFSFAAARRALVDLLGAGAPV